MTYHSPTTTIRQHDQILNLTSGLIFIGFILVGGIYYYQALLEKRKRKHLPPGPKGLPIIGNAHQILLDECVWLKLDRWRELYGNLIYVNLAGHDVVILGNTKVAFDLLNRRSYNYSARARNIVGGEIMTGGYGMNFLQRNDIWRRSRRAANEALKSQTLKAYHPIQYSGVLNLIDQYLHRPTQWRLYLDQERASTVFRLLYGNSESNESDKKLILEFTNVVLKAAGPAAHFVEYFTWMEYLPRWMSPWRVMAEEWHEKGDALMLRLFDGVKQRMKNGEQEPCIASKIYEEASHDLTDKEIAWVLGTLYAAGTDTIIGTSTWFFLAMAAYPSVQSKAQAQLDQVVGRDRTPYFSDSSSLPYIHALIREINRWRPIAPFAMPHKSEEDDIYEGQFIPKGTLCIPNVWAINHDKDVYGPDADAFRPERFLDPDSGQLLPPIPETQDESHATFGFGRRICVGRHLANENLFIALAMVLWAFKIETVGDGVVKEDEFSDDGLILHPKDFNCRLRPRFDGVAQIIQQAKERDESMNN